MCGFSSWQHELDPQPRASINHQTCKQISLQIPVKSSALSLLAVVPDIIQQRQTISPYPIQTTDPKKL